MRRIEDTRSQKPGVLYRWPRAIYYKTTDLGNDEVAKYENRCGLGSVSILRNAHDCSLGAIDTQIESVK